MENFTQFGQLYETEGRTLQCLNHHMSQVPITLLAKKLFHKKQVGALAETSQRICLSACTRQENPVVVSSYSFPNNMFLSSYEVVELIRRLHMSCNAKNKMYGPRRPLLDEQYPQLCPFIDQIPKKILTIELTAYHFFSSLNMSEYDLGQFKKQLLDYASRNLVRINAYFDSPYLSKFHTDEVHIFVIMIFIVVVFGHQVMSLTTFIANIGGTLGLCMGFSFVSLVEVFIFLFSSFIRIIKGRNIATV